MADVKSDFAISKSISSKSLWLLSQAFQKTKKYFEKINKIYNLQFIGVQFQLEGYPLTKQTMEK